MATKPATNGHAALSMRLLDVQAMLLRERLFRGVLTPEEREVGHLLTLAISVLSGERAPTPRPEQ